MTTTATLLVVYFIIGACFAAAMRVMYWLDYKDGQRGGYGSFAEFIFLEVSALASLVFCWPLAFLVLCLARR